MVIGVKDGIDFFIETLLNHEKKRVLEEVIMGNIMGSGNLMN